ncbi:TonB-dependent receptor [Algoriphagus sp. Y33]|uniref:SusC/RagA family TonB-linked outer membrane protein n=1 Tax=Algoriphagus sp. Y33 TaxID=2772483 RepID=UPI00177E50F0|nr:TonB-dependent receptor [Algoriphagus sp. Y33]
MRLFYSVFISCLLTTSLLAGNASGQDLESTKVRLNSNYTNLKQILSAIESQTDFLFTYNEAINPNKIKVPITGGEKSLLKVLEHISRSTDLSFKQINSMIAIKEKEAGLEKKTPEFQLYSGTVMDGESDEPLPGATVQIKGSTTGTVTDANGGFELNAEAGQTLVISFIGYESQEILLGDNLTITVYLGGDTKALDEVVIVGFGEQKKVNVTGAVEMVTSEDLENRPTTNTSNLLQGLMPGLVVQNYTAMPGQDNGSIRIRGLSSINNSNPLVIIDGIEGNMNILNPDDIESVSVLKDAASASIYGSRGANGVILITTKSGKRKGAPQISINSYFGIQQPLQMPDMLGSVEMMQLQNEALRNVGQSETYSPEDIQKVIDGSDPNFSANTNWIEEVFRTRAPQHQTNVSVSGGAENLSYLVSYGHLNQDGLVIGDAYSSKRNNLRFKLNTTLLDVVDLNANIGYIDRVYHSPQWATEAAGGVIRGALTISPLVPVRYTNGEWGYGGGSNNPVAIATDGGSNVFSSQEFTANITAQINLHKNLSIKGQYGQVMSNSRRETFVKKVVHRHPDSGDILWFNVEENSLEIRDYVNRYQNALAQLDYKNTWGDHNFSVLLAFQQEWQRYESFSATRRNFLSEDVPALNLGTNPVQSNSGDGYHWALRSGIARLNYDFKGKYLLELNGRYDGSSRLSENNRYKFFPSFSAGWRFSDEGFFEGLKKVVYDGKARVSFGELGNQYLSNMTGYAEYYAYLPVLNAVETMPIGDQRTNGFAQTISAGTNLSWETVQMLNIGLDLYFFEGRLSFVGDWFNKQTKNILLRVPQPSVLGITPSDINAGAVENKGWEVSLDWQDQIKEFRYGLNVQLSDVQNKILDMGDTPPAYATNVNLVGHASGSYYGFVATRLAQESDFDLIDGELVPTIPVTASEISKFAPGDLVYEDLNGDGEITAEGDRRVLGNAFPRYTYSIRGNIGWKGFDMSFFLQGVGKAVGYLYDNARHAFKSSSMYPQTIHRDRWTPDNTDASYPRLIFGETYNSRVSSYWLEDASYLRLKNLQIGYSLPAHLLDRLRVNKFRVYFSGDNLLTKTNFYYAYDPESPLSAGGYYPQAKTFTMGVNIGLK